MDSRLDSRCLWLPSDPQGKIVIVNSSSEFCARPSYAGQHHWGPSGDYALALKAMKANNMSIWEIVTASLDAVNVLADVYFLRDWRYSPKELIRLRERFPDATQVLDLRIQPFEIHSMQRQGEYWHFLGKGQRPIWPPEAPFRYSSETIGIPTIVWVGAHLNITLIKELGINLCNYRVRPHITPWESKNNDFKALDILPKPKRNHKQLKILFLGRCMFRKGLFRLFRALQRLDISNWELTVVTNSIRDGKIYSYDDHIITDNPAIIDELLSHPKIKLLPYNQSRTKLIKLYKDSDLYICPSVSDNGPNTVVESLILGTPTIVSDMSGSLEAVPDTYRRVWEAPKWWKSDDFSACEDTLAEAIYLYYEHIFLKGLVAEYGEDLRKAFLEQNILRTLYREYRDVFRGASKSISEP